MDRKKFQAAINASTKGVQATIPTELKLKKGAAKEVTAEANVELAKQKPKPTLEVDLKVRPGQVREVVRETNAKLKAAKNPPKINVGMTTTVNQAKAVIREANLKLKQAKVAPPKLNVQLNLTTDELEAIREVRIMSKQVEAAIKADPIELSVDLDEKAQAALLAKVQLLKAKADAAGVTAFQRTQGRIDALVAAGLDQRSLVEQRFQNQRALIHERAEARIRSSSGTTLRQLRNDLSQFDATTTRTLRTLGRSFSLFTLGVVASFGAISTAAVVQFGKIEQSANRAASLFTAQALGGSGLTGGAFENRLISLNRTITDEITNTARSVAVATKFNTEEIADGFRFLAGAGVDLRQSLQSIDTVARLAQAGFMELEDTSDLLVQGFIAAGGDITQFSNQVDELSDKLVFVANESAVTLEEALKAFSNRAGASFKAVGQSADEALNVIRLFGQTGIKGLKAGEQSAILIREITRSATIKAPEAWKRLGIEIKNADGSARSFAQVLDDLTRVTARETRGFKDPAALVKLFNEELKLTEKSSGGLRQLIPSIAELQRRGSGAFKELRRLQTESAGRLSAQTKAVTDTLSFQFEAFTNNISNIASLFASGAGRSITEFLKDINGEAGTGSSLFSKLSDEAEGFGKRFGTFVGGALEQLKGPEGKEFFGGIVEGFDATLSGVRGLFVAFRKEVFGAGSSEGFFAVAGKAFAGLGRFARDTLPRVGKALGTIVSFIDDHEASVRAFVKTWLGMFLVSKALRLALVPIIGIGDNIDRVSRAIKRLMAIEFVSSIAGWVTQMLGFRKATMAAKVATDALAASQARLAATQLISGLPVPGKGLRASRGATAASGAAASGAAADAAVGARSLAPAAASASRFAGVLSAVSAALKLVSKAFVPVVFFAGILKGAIDQLSVEFGGDGDTSLRDFAKALKVVGDAIWFVLKPALDLLTFLTDMVFLFGKMGGGGFVTLVAIAVRSFGAAAKWAAEQLGALLGWVEKWLNKIPGFEAGTKRVGDGLKKVGDGAEWLGHKIGLLNDAAAAGFGALAEQAREVYGENNVLAQSYEHLSNTIADTKAQGFVINTAFTRMNATYAVMNRNANLAARAHEMEATGILGIAKGIPSYIKLTAVQRAQRLSTEQAAASATDFQKRQANLAYVHDLLTGKVKNAADMQRVLASSSKNASTNLVRLAGGKDKLAALTQSIASGNDAAARTYLRLAADAAYAARAVQIAAGKAADAQLALINSNMQIEHGGMASPAAAQALINQSRAGQNAQQSLRLFMSDQREFVRSLQAMSDADWGDPLGNLGDDAEDAAEEIKTVKTAAEKAVDAVNKLTQVQLNRQASIVVGRVTRAAADGYHATAYEAEILRRVLPGVEAELQKQQAAVAKLDEALQALQATQLKGTKAFSDQAFSLDQNIKRLQLQRLDLIISGKAEDSGAVKKIDEQIAVLQQRTERLSLVESLKLDPLKKKLEETFNPVKELSFGEIIKQFEAIRAQKAPLTEAIAGGENLKATLEAAISDAEARFGEAGKQVTAGFVGGIRGQLPKVTEAGADSGNAALAGVNQVMQFGSPSKTMIQRGVWVTDGFTIGIKRGQNEVLAAGVQTMFSFLTGMRNVWTNRVQPFVKEIAEWIKANKGPIAYDRTLLQPAGTAIMEGFNKGLRDGFGEIQTWVRTVGPSVATDAFPKELFIQRSARFLLNNTKVDTDFSPEDAFGDLIPFDLMAGLGGFDPSLSFLHKTLSLADTGEMAQRLAGMLPGGAVTALKYDHNKFTTSGNVSDHFFGTAADISNGTSPTPGMDRLFDLLKPLVGEVFKQLIYKHVSARSDSGLGYYGASDHFNHIHAAWLKGDNFSLNSGRKGVGMLNIPGVSPDVLSAIAYASQKVKLDPWLIAAVMKQESGFRKNAVSPDGGYGLMQLTSSNLVAQADALGGRFNPLANAFVGSRYLKDLISQLGSTKLGLSAYNSGPGGGERYGHIDVPNYVSSVLSILEDLRRRYMRGTGNFRAQGGKVNAMTPYVVGERGQELFIPSSNGSVVSNRDLRDLISSMRSKPADQKSTDINYNPTFNIESNSTDPATIAALVDSRMRSQVAGVRR